MIPPAPAPAVEASTGTAPVSAVALLAVLVLFLAAGGAAYLVYEHPGAKPLAAAAGVLAVLVPVFLVAFRRR